jgi:O-acetyl-ADP-ribose deacetylase (regulator of RNase III)
MTDEELGEYLMERVRVVQGDIADLPSHVDAIVNAANAKLQNGSGVCGAIFTAADQGEHLGHSNLGMLQAECNIYGSCPTGEACMTESYGLRTKCIKLIHGVGPDCRTGPSGQYEPRVHDNLLKSCYIDCLNKARNERLATIAFPLISTGVYAFPVDDAIRIAVEAVATWASTDWNDVSVLHDIFFVIKDSSERPADNIIQAFSRHMYSIFRRT